MTDTPITTPLKPCPFCGGEAHIEIGLMKFIDAEIQCKCGASVGNYPSADAAIAAWNTRADRLAAAVTLAIGVFPAVIHRKEILRGRMVSGEYLDTAQGYVTKEDCLAYGVKISLAQETPQ